MVCRSSRPESPATRRRTAALRGEAIDTAPAASARRRWPLRRSGEVAAPALAVRLPFGKIHQLNHGWFRRAAHQPSVTVACRTVAARRMPAQSAKPAAPANRRQPRKQPLDFPFQSAAGGLPWRSASRKSLGLAPPCFVRACGRAAASASEANPRSGARRVAPVRRRTGDRAVKSRRRARKPRHPSSRNALGAARRCLRAGRPRRR